MAQRFFSFFIDRIYRIKLLPAVLISLIFLSIFAGFVSQALSVYFTYKKAVYKTMKLSIDNFHFFLKESVDNFIFSLTTASLPLETQLKTFFYKRLTIKIFSNGLITVIK